MKNQELISSFEIAIDKYVPHKKIAGEMKSDIPTLVKMGTINENTIPSVEYIKKLLSFYVY